HLTDDVGQRMAFDELHGVEVDAAFASHRKDRNDVRVMELCGGLGLVVEALKMLGIEGGRERQDFQRDAPAERKLHRLIDDAHAAAADLAENSEVAERLARQRIASSRRGDGIRRLVPARRAMDEIETPQALRQRLGDIGETTQELVLIRTPTSLQK